MIFLFWTRTRTPVMWNQMKTTKTRNDGRNESGEEKSRTVTVIKENNSVLYDLLSSIFWIFL